MANTLDLISSAIKGYVVSPLNAFGIGGFVFNVQGDGVAQLSTDITDHYTEDKGDRIRRAVLARGNDCIRALNEETDKYDITFRQTDHESDSQV